jgi:hypothetical protein
MATRESDSVVPPNKLGPGWYFIPLRDTVVWHPRDEEQRKLQNDLNAGISLFDQLGIGPSGEQPVAEVHDVSDTPPAN